jgi:serralysin
MADIFSLVPITVPYNAVHAILPNGNATLDQALTISPRWNKPGAVGSAVSLTYFVSDVPPSYSLNIHGYTDATALEWSIAQKSVIDSVLSTYSQVANIKFTKVATQAEANISFFLSSSLEPSGFAYSPGSINQKGTIHGDIYLDLESFPANGANPYLAFHEIGHALGLLHLYDTDNKPTIEAFGLPGGRLFSVVDQRPMEKPYYVFQTTTGYSATAIFQPAGPMLLDIQALQLLYGANMNTAAGDNTYKFPTNPNFYRTIWDAGGHDTIDVSNQINPCYITLVSGTYSTIGLRDPFAGIPDPVKTWALGLRPEAQWNDGANSLVIAFNSTIEDVIGSQTDDVLIGNNVANKLTGGRGNDRLDGGGGIDVAVYVGTRSQYTITKNANGFEIGTLTEGKDQLTAIERLKFVDIHVALDMAGNAGKVAKLLGAVFGADSVANKAYAGKGLSLLDGGMSYEALGAFAVAATGKSAYADIVELLWTNVVGTQITPDALVHYQGLLETGMSVGKLAVFAADANENMANIDIVGLATSGLAYNYV